MTRNWEKASRVAATRNVGHKYAIVKSHAHMREHIMHYAIFFSDKAVRRIYIYDYIYICTFIDSFYICARISVEFDYRIRSGSAKDRVKKRNGRVLCWPRIMWFSIKNLYSFGGLIYLAKRISCSVQ